ncbi:MAG TPA: APC family permease [Abditibacteriaceae bacterium]|jgi:amino acid transporter
MSFSLKRFLVGKPIETAQAHHERLPKVTALAVFASDALSSTAYATQEIMLALMLTVSFASTASLNNLSHILPIAIGIGVLLTIVSISYRQTVYAYPQGGGAYLVAKENLGQTVGLVAAAALLIDYVLTVAVSIAAGVAAITSAIPALKNDTVPLAFFFIAFVTILNLRGSKESGTLFAIPTYLFIASMVVLLGVGFFRYSTGTLAAYAPLTAQLSGSIVNPHVAQISIFLLLRAFASGCTALAGIEAISDGVPAFRAPEARNAAITLVWMSSILVTLFLGITTLAYLTKTQPILSTVIEGGQRVMEIEHNHVADPQETLISVLAHRAFDGTLFSWFYYVISAGTAMILILAANTAFQDFPRLSSVLSKDRFMPRQFANLGDRLVFNNGIIALALFSALLIWIFKGSVTALLALYAVGVFLSFTLSQAGMVMHWRKLRSPRWQVSAFVNGIGAICTFIVMCIIALTKFLGGAWMVIAAIPFIVMLLRRINLHYQSVSQQLSLSDYRPSQAMRHHVLVLAPDIHRGVIPALQYARSISEDAKGLHIATDPQREKRVRKRWTQWSRGIPLVVLDSPYRSLVAPVVEYIERLQKQEPNSIVTLVVPEFVPTGWFPKLLHGQAALLLSVKLRYMKGVVVVSVPYHIEAYIELPANWENVTVTPYEETPARAH